MYTYFWNFLEDLEEHLFHILYLKKFLDYHNFAPKKMLLGKSDFFL